MLFFYISASSVSYMLRFVLSVVVLLILSSCGGKYAFEMSRNYAPPYNPGGDYFDDDESFAQSYEIYEKRREDALREQESMKKRNRGRDLQQKSGRRQISDEEKGRIINELQRYGVMYNAGERRKGGMVNSEGIDLSRVRGARFIDVDLNKSGVISGKEERVDESILVKTKEGELLDAEEQSSMLSGGLPGDSADEEHEEFEVNIDCDCGDDCDCPTGAHKSHGGHKKLSHPVEVEEEQSPALDVISSELPKDDIAEDQEGIGVKGGCNAGDDSDCPTGAHKSHGGHKKLSHPVEVKEEQRPALDVISSELPKDDIAEDQEGIGVKGGCNAGDDCPSDELNLEHGNKEVAVYGEEGASSKDEDNVAEYGSVGDVGADRDDVAEGNDIYPWWEEYDVVEGFGAFDDSSDGEGYYSESSPVFGEEERAEEDFDVYQDPVEVDDEGVTDSSEDLEADSGADSVTDWEEEGDYLPNDGDVTTSSSAGKGAADDLSVDDSTFLDEGEEGGYKGIDKDSDGYRIPMSLPDSRSRYYDLGDFVSLR
ncbi:TRP75-related protein [Anaplasma phagocytophilum]|uniref:TRP75-related protein n=1 Tax=Anaplasma phagocytophilum TaxID=948 RepID=UPI00035AAACD|nr:TRP75-related protein [Anaplasma phagocytophilum]EOA60805.1 hypothetical protein HGE1_02037 [Anaplasma phagocytophilum str. HGE1]